MDLRGVPTRHEDLLGTALNHGVPPGRALSGARTLASGVEPKDPAPPVVMLRDALGDVVSGEGMGTGPFAGSARRYRGVPDTYPVPSRYTPYSHHTLPPNSTGSSQPVTRRI